MGQSRSIRFLMRFAQNYISRTTTFKMVTDDKKCKAGQGTDGQTGTNYQAIDRKNK